MADITLTDEQNAAVKKIKEWYNGGSKTKQVFRLEGPAGVGKTVVIKEILREINVKAITTAFTGKAANVLRQKGNPNACTMHSGMYIPIEDEHGNVEFTITHEAPFHRYDLIVVDEGSQINEIMAKDAESFGKKILVVGDPGQLQPVEGYGYWMKGEPDVRLTKVHRQALDSPIIRFATMLRLKQRLPFGEWQDDEGNVTRILRYNNDNLHYMFREETQPICGTNKNRWALTQYIRSMKGFEGVHPLQNEVLICCKNQSKLGIFNGSFGTLIKTPTVLTNGDYILQMNMEDLPHPLKHLRTSPYLFQQHFDPNIRIVNRDKTIHSFDFGYVLTCHKAQGSEFSDVSVADDGAVFREDQWRWRYTAVTRSAKSLTYLQR